MINPQGIADASRDRGGIVCIAGIAMGQAVLKLADHVSVLHAGQVTVERHVDVFAQKVN